MPLDFSMSGLVDKVAPNFSVSDQLSMYKDDVNDTLHNQAQALDFLIKCQTAVTRQELNDALTDCPVTITFDDKLYEIATVPGNTAMNINMILENSKELAGTIDLTDWQPGYDLSITLPETGEVMDLCGNVTAYVQDSMASCEVLNSYIDAAAGNIANVSSSVIGDFNNAVSGIKGGSSSVDDLIARLSSSTNACGNNSSGALAVVKEVFSNICTTTVDNSGEIQFNNKQYYVQGFAYSHIIQTAVQSASTLISGVISVVMPIVGFTLMNAFSLLGNLFSANYIESATIPTVDDDASNVDFAVPILQGTATVAEVRNLVNLYSLGDYTDYYDLLISNMIDKGKACTLKFAYGDIILWLSDSDNNINAEVYVDTDLYNSHGLYQLGHGSVSNNKLTCNNSFDISANTSLNMKTYAMHEWGKSAYMYRNGELPKQYPTTSTMYLSAINHNVQALISLVHQGGFSNVEMTRNGTNEQAAAYWFKACDDVADWDELVNECFVDMRNKYLGALTFRAALATLLNAWFDTFDWQPYRYTYSSTDYDNDITNYFGDTNNHKANDPMFYLLDRGHFKVSPPSYSSKAISRTRWITLGIALGTVGALVTANVVKAKLKPMMAKKYLDVQAKQAAYTEDPSDKKYLDVQAKQAAYTEDPSDEKFKDYWKSLKRYNLLAGFTGYSKLSKVSGWEVGDESSAAMTNVDSIFSRLSAITGDGTTTENGVEKPIDLTAITKLIR